MNYVDKFGSVNDMLYDAYMQVSDIRLRYENLDYDDIFEEQSPNAFAHKFYDMLASANEPIYEGATKSKLSIVIRLLATRTNWHAPEKCLDYVIKMLNDVAPKQNFILKNYYEAKKIVSSLGLEAEKIDCCECGCMLYYKDDIYLTESKFCHLPRYFEPKGDRGRYKNIPRKRMFYLPIIPRLQRLYASMESASQMRWHFENRKDDGLLRHPCDGEAWKHFDKIYPDFACDPRHVRLGLCSDGFTPYVQASTSPYSCWPVFITPYNLPPEMCMTKPYMFLTCLIPGPNNPTKQIDVYSQPLIDDLNKLWNEGVFTYDISKNENFVMRACLMWTHVTSWYVVSAAKFAFKLNQCGCSLHFLDTN